MTGSIAKNLWLRQTTYTVIVVAIVAIAVSGMEVIISYQSEHKRLQQFGDNLTRSFSDAAARSAFHVDARQASSVVDGLMSYDILDNVRITTDLGLVLANRSRRSDESTSNFLADWLFSDVTSFHKDLAIDRSEFVSGLRFDDTDGIVPVGNLELHANAALVGRQFINDIRARVIGLAFEFIVLATAIALIFYRTITRPLANVAEQLDSIDPRGTELGSVAPSPQHMHDELGLVIERTNGLLTRISEQQTDLIHREKIAALGSMLAEVAHELNNPLAVVSAQAELLAETATDPKIQSRAEKILRPARRSADIVRKFLSLARQRKIENSVLNVRKLINESVEMLAYQFAKRNIVVKTDIHTRDARIWGDGAQLGQVLMNILINAQQALAETEGEKVIQITVRTDDNSGNVVISVTDNGIGIPEGIREKVFDHFFTTKPEGRGTGLGLSFCKSVVEGHGGKIAVRDNTAQGTEVVMELPTTARSELQAAGRVHLGHALSALRVLVVDDEESLTQSIAEILSRYGHVAEVAYSAEQAMEILATEHIDIVLADVHMPGIDGMEFYYKVQAEYPDLSEKFVFITGDSLDPQLLEFFEKENRPHLNKPFELQELIAVVEHVLLKPTTNKWLENKSKELGNA